MFDVWETQVVQAFCERSSCCALAVSLSIVDSYDAPNPLEFKLLGPSRSSSGC